MFVSPINSSLSIVLSFNSLFPICTVDIDELLFILTLYKFFENISILFSLYKLTLFGTNEFIFSYGKPL